MKKPWKKPKLFRKKFHEISLIEPVLIELLQLVLGKGGYFRFRVKGFNISPFVKDDDVVTVSPLQKASPLLNDLVIFIHPKTKKLVVQKVIGKRNDSYLLKENSASVRYNSVPKLDILGRVEKVERNGKQIFI